MNIYINDKATEVADNASIATIVAQLAIPEKGTAIAVNGTLAPRDSWADTLLVENDKLLIISAAYGG